MKFKFLLVLICSVSVCGMAQSDHSTTCFPFLSAALSSDTMCVPVDSLQILVFVNEIFCSKCLTTLDAFLSTNEILGGDYYILFVRSVKKSYVNSVLSRLGRLIQDVNKLHFVELTVPGKLGIPTDVSGSPYVLIKGANTDVLISYDELFSDDVSGELLTVGSNAILKAYRRD